MPGINKQREATRLVIHGGRVIDPANCVDETRDLFVRDGVIVDPFVFNVNEPGVETIEAHGLVVSPGLIDIHVHLREPGQSAKETIETGANAAAAGGFTTVVCMPNTNPAVDSTETVFWIKEQARLNARVNVLPTGAITQGLGGLKLTPFSELKQAGIVALTDDGRCVQDNGLMRRALHAAHELDLVVLDHCQDYSLVKDGVMHEGDLSRKLGLPGWPAAGEEAIILRNALLAELTGGAIHCQHLSSAGSVRALREARGRGVPISGEVCPHHIVLTDASVQSMDPNYKMNPPLRSQADVEALVEGIADGTITVLCSDHAPHTEVEKAQCFERAPFGILGLETEFSLFYQKLVLETGAISLARLIELLTIAPARLLGLDRGTLSTGCVADITIIDPAQVWVVDPACFASKSRNSPFGGWQLTGRPIRTVVGGHSVWSLETGLA